MAAPIVDFGGRCTESVDRVGKHAIAIRRIGFSGLHDGNHDIPIGRCRQTCEVGERIVRRKLDGVEVDVVWAHPDADEHRSIVSKCVEAPQRNRAKQR